MFVFIQSVSAALVFSSQWVTGDCQGPPNTMFLFDLKSDGKTPTETEIWPSFYEFVVDEYSMGICGNLIAPKSRGCCYSSLDTTLSNGLQSGSFQPLEGRPTSNAPAAANNQFYCSLGSTTREELTYNSLWILPTNTCVEKHYVCSKDGVLQVFPQENCQGAVERFQLNNTAQQISTIKGRFNAQFGIIQDGSVQYSWTAFTPSAFLVPRFQIVGDFLGTAMFSLAVLGATGTVVYFIRKFSEKRTSYMKFFLISQIVWFFWVVAKMAYYYIIFDTNQQFMIYSQIMNVVFNLATVSTVLNSAAFLIKFQHLKSKIHRALFYSCLVLLHLVLSGALYFDYFRFDGPYIEMIKKWNQFAIAWIVFMFIFNMLPSIFVTSALLQFQDQDSSLTRRFINLHHMDARFSRLALSQFAVIIGYATCAVLKNTAILLNDRNYLGMDAFLAFFLVWHSILNCLFIQNVGVITQLKSRMKSSNGISYSTSQNRSIFSHDASRTDQQYFGNK
jgi:hypothetical protein